MYVLVAVSLTLCFCLFCSVERERLRERQREERAQMTYSSSDTELLPAEPLFGELVKVSVFSRFQLFLFE